MILLPVLGFIISSFAVEAAAGPTTTASQPVDYSLDVLLRHVENPSGLKADGKPCSKFAFAGAQCTMKLSAGVCLGKSCSVTDLYNEVISTDSNKADLRPIPVHLSLEGDNFEGFTIKVVLEDCSISEADCVPIDSYTHTVTPDTSQGSVDGYETYTNRVENHARSSLTFAYIVNAPVLQTTTVAATTATVPTAQSGATVPTTTPTTAAATTTIAPPPASDCYSSTKRISGPQEIDIGNGSFVYVYCDFGKNNSNALTVIQSRGEKDETDFDRDIAGYTEKFGDPGVGKNYWMGLENMRIFTQGKQYVLIVDLCCSKTALQRQLYHNFEIGSAPYYKLTATADVEKIGLAYFSSATAKTDIGVNFQQANSTDPDTCEVAYYWTDKPDPMPSTGAWWFGSCANNLNGKYVKTGNSSCIGDVSLTGTTGIEMRRDTAFGNGDDTDKVMYDRVRMSVIPNTADLKNLPSANDFCAEP